MLNCMPSLIHSVFFKFCRNEEFPLIKLVFRTQNETLPGAALIRCTSFSIVSFNNFVQSFLASINLNMKILSYSSDLIRSAKWCYSQWTVYIHEIRTVPFGSDGTCETVVLHRERRPKGVAALGLPMTSMSLNRFKVHASVTPYVSTSIELMNTLWGLSCSVSSFCSQFRLHCNSMNKSNTYHSKIFEFLTSFGHFNW